MARHIGIWTTLFVFSFIFAFAAVTPRAMALGVDGSLATGVESGTETSSAVHLGGRAGLFAGRHRIADSRVGLRLGTDQLAVDELRYNAYGQSTKGGFSWHIGAVGYDDKPMISTGTIHADIGGVRYQRDEPIAADVAFLLDIEMALSVLESTTTGALGESSPGRFYLCGSASTFDLEVGTEYAEALALLLTLEMRRDPFHFGDGSNCLGHPESYSTADRRGVALRYRSGRFFLRLTVEHVAETRYVDVSRDTHGSHEESTDGHRFEEDESASQWVGSAIAGVRW